MIKTGQEFQEVVYGYWSRRFTCDRNNFKTLGTHIIKEEELNGTNKAIVYHIDKMSVVRIDPLLVRKMRLLDKLDGKAISLAVNDLQASAEDKYRIELTSTLLDCFLDANDFKPHTVPADFTARRVFPENGSAQLSDLFHACTAEDLDEADIYVDDPDPVIYGMFDGESMVAYASHRYWDNVIADMGVLIHPAYRSRGLGKAVVSALCAWCIQNEIVPMYRVFDDHTHSVKIPQALGFKELVVIESLKCIDTSRT
ncbi:MAG: GNAT family N-acetyltransferase [Anaerolineaceae bacterium]|nr:GNAT family N-acetyltransferase [Anaerolineaceae bacterium]